MAAEQRQEWSQNRDTNGSRIGARMVAEQSQNGSTIGARIVQDASSDSQQSRYGRRSGEQIRKRRMNLSGS